MLQIHPSHLFTIPVALGLAAHAVAAPVDFARQVKPLIESTCISCHGDAKQEAELRLDTREAAMKGGDNGVVIVPGKPLESSFYTTTILPADDEKVMPPKKKGLLEKEQTEILRAWIEDGAKWPEGVKLRQIRRVDFVKDVQPILETECISCHGPTKQEAELRLDTREATAKGGDNGEVIIPGDASKSSVYTTLILAEDDDALMPPKKKGGPMPKEKIEIIRDWIDGGAFWPAGLTLTAKKKAEGPSGDSAELIAALHTRIAAQSNQETGQMQPYTGEITGCDIKFQMVPIPAGKFVMGSPATEKGHKVDESPTHEVQIESFWMGKHEVTWNEFELFMYRHEEKKMREGKNLPESLNAETDACSRPTQPYVEMSFGMGKDGFPAISMTHHAANKYCQWLSAKTGHFYRLPTEAEWEYACRAGTTTAYYWGDDASKLGEHAWWGKNADFKYQKVGRKKPNAWGLHDMVGNVWEWCIDQYDPEYYKNPGAWNRSKTPYPHVVRGGSWDDEDPTRLRSAARRASHSDWKIQDPQLPKSIWYHTDAQFLGFRLVRPLKVPSAEEMNAYWNNGVEKDDPNLKKAE